MKDVDRSPEKALEKSPFQLTGDDVCDVSTVLGQDLMQLSTRPQVTVACGQLQYRILEFLENLEVLVTERQLRQEQEEPSHSAVLNPTPPAAASGTSADSAAPGPSAAEGKRQQEAREAVAETEGKVVRNETEARKVSGIVSKAE
ncbi:RILP-like protein 2 [Pithys albifrons albifrons]|uniref:RILP-like protein 2 n=1 Tax=Pithys albifrons albifrons TaxID=3385563 RepID=UPI003A5CDECF